MGDLVLVVEDHIRSRAALKELLLLDGFEVVTAGTGGEALELIHTHQPTVAIVDYALPDMTADEVLRRSAPTTSEFIVVSGSSIHDAVEGRFTTAWAACEKLGAVAWFKKPVDYDRLVRLLLQLFDR